MHSIKQKGHIRASKVNHKNTPAINGYIVIVSDIRIKAECAEKLEFSFAMKCHCERFWETAYCFGRDKTVVLGTEKGQLGFLSLVSI